MSTFVPVGLRILLCAVRHVIPRSTFLGVDCRLKSGKGGFLQMKSPFPVSMLRSLLKKAPDVAKTGGRRMRMQMDKRPTLASWPKRVYAWEELPEPFHPALREWKESGMPPGNVTYIPQVSQKSREPEYAAAWWGKQVLIQTAQRDQVDTISLDADRVHLCSYQVQLLRCLVELDIEGGKRAVFSYNKVKEEQLRPVLNLALGNTADFVFPTEHPQTMELQKLLKDSYAMYNLSKLCYRFGTRLLDFLWLRGRDRNLFRKVDPEYWIGATERGLTAISYDRYGTRTVWLRWKNLTRLSMEGSGRSRYIRITSVQGMAVEFPVLEEQAGTGALFLERVERLRMQELSV